MTLNNNTICDCIQCQSGRYNPSDYIVTEEEFANLYKERPIGITGHLRAKNEALAIGECIESCIDFLDELIITYNDSFDLTEEIIKKYELMYPNKIRVYHYKAMVTPCTWSYRYKDLNQTMAFPDDCSIHNPANYYNFGYVRASFKYYMKIDADQVYFTEKMLDIRKILINDNNHTSLNKNIECYVKDNSNKKDDFGLVLGGINICGDDTEFSVQVKNSQTFNGCTKNDHVIWIPNNNRRYRFDREVMYERIDAGNKPYYCGFGWLHLGLVKLVTQGQEIKVQKTEYNYNLNDFANMTWVQLMDNDDFNQEQVKRKIYLNIGENWWDKDRKYMLDLLEDEKIERIFNYYKSYLTSKNIINSMSKKIVELENTIANTTNTKDLISTEMKDLMVLNNKTISNTITTLEQQNNELLSQIKENNKQINALTKSKNKEFNKLNGQLKWARGELSNVRNSTSYKLGRMITWLPRKIRGDK